MLDGPTQLPCRSYNADFRTPAEGSLHPVIFVPQLDWIKLRMKVCWALVPLVKKNQLKSKLFLKMSATAFSLTLMWNSSLNSLISRQSIPFQVPFSLPGCPVAIACVSLNGTKNNGESVLGICTWTQSQKGFELLAQKNLDAGGIGDPKWSKQIYILVLADSTLMFICWDHLSVWTLYFAEGRNEMGCREHLLMVTGKGNIFSCHWKKHAFTGVRKPIWTASRFG